MIYSSPISKKHFWSLNLQNIKEFHNFSLEIALKESSVKEIRNENFFIFKVPVIF